MTPDERERMRDILGSAVARARLPGAELVHPGAFQPPPTPAYDVVDRFRKELTALGGTVHDADDADAIVATVRTLLSSAPEPRVLAWSAESLPVPGIGPALTAAGVTLVGQPPELARSMAHRRRMASIELGLTGADAGLAETGSIVLCSGPGRGRLASLLPPVHVALLRRTDIVESLSVLIARRPELVTAGANFVCITGPSRTADIEHTLSRGVHGPREVHVILVAPNL
jgi:L-lactate dehydrogenase complex protein LldG